jgi:glycosyltransferase involved in cell wall biosynthesis
VPPPHHHDTPATSRPNVAIVHDYLTQRGGAERVVLSMLKAFPGAPLYTSLYEPDATYPEFADHDVRTLWTNRLRSLRTDHRRGLPMYPLAFSGLRIADADVVLCSSSAFAHGVRTDARKIVYCHTPPRWLYDEADTYLAGWSGPVRAANRAIAAPMRRWDRRAAYSANSYIANSTAVQDRIRSTYGIAAPVVAPAVSPPGEDAVPVPAVRHPFVLCASRLLAYKNVDAVVAAFGQVSDATLVVVGDGPEARRLQAIAGTNVMFLGRVTDAELCWLYSECEGLVAAAFEDFGLTPIEAAAFGKPSAVLRAGGFLDTVVEGKTGVFFENLTPGAIAAGVNRILRHRWDARTITVHAAHFGEDRFADELRAVALDQVA